MKKLLSILFILWFLLISGCSKENTTSSSQITTGQLYTLQDVAAHASSTGCWAIVRNNVYDFTTRASKHPGWPEKILAICWKDATPIFEKVHGGKEKPEMKLKEFYIWSIK